MRKKVKWKRKRKEKEKRKTLGEEKQLVIFRLVMVENPPGLMQGNCCCWGAKLSFRNLPSLLYSLHPSSMLLLFFFTTSTASAGGPSPVELISNTINKLTGIFLIGGGGGGGGGGDEGHDSGFWKYTTASNAGVAFAVTALAGLALGAAVLCNTR